jgi:phosphoribosylglycinamide formyltransferase-1
VLAYRKVTTLPMTNMKKKIAIFGSGTGTNAQKIIDHGKQTSSLFEVSLIACNKPDAGILQIAEKEDIPSILIDKEQFYQGDGYTRILKVKNIRLIVLAGFLWKIPQKLIDAFPRRIINIHPALLPKYGGQGMYGKHVHQAVLDNKEKESGITIHYVDEHYDNGDIILQEKCTVLETDTSATLAERVSRLEHEYYPQLIERLLT